MMQRFGRPFLGILVACAVLLPIAWISTMPMSLGEGHDALVRLSLGARPERVEVCRAQSDEELLKVAPQMRQQVICEGTTAKYRLQMFRDGQLLLNRSLRGGGMRHDRQLYIAQDLNVPAGSARYEVQLNRIDSLGPQPEREDDTEKGRALSARRRRTRDESIPGTLRLDLDVMLKAGEVLLITYDPEKRQLVSRLAIRPAR